MPVQYLTGTPFPEWSTQTVETAVGKQLSETAKKAQKFYNGDHWQDSEGWGGPVPDPLTTKPEDAVAFIAKVQRAFTSANVLAEVVDRHVSAVMGRAPGWQFVPISAPEGSGEGPDLPEPGKEQKPKKDPAIAEIEDAITEWMDKRNAHQFLLESAADYATTGKGMVRLFVPPGLLQRTADGKGLTVPSGLTLQEALDLVYIEKVDPKQGGSAWDRDTMSEAAFATWEEEVQSGGSSQRTKRTELQYIVKVGKVRKTVLQTWNGQEKLPSLDLDLGGRLLMHEMRGKPLVTEQLMQLQKGLNFAMTAMGHNNANAGFMERIITNAQTPGTYETDTKTGQKVFKPSERYSGGAGSTVFLTGHPVNDEEGKVTGYTDPRPWFRDPSSPEAFRASLDEYRAAMYMETKQGHLLSQGDGSVSGASRVHLRADFEVSLRDTRVAAEDTYRWLLGVLAKLGALFTGNATKYDKLRPTVQANVNAGPLTDAERTAILDQYKEGLRSRESAMVLLGVDDPDAEFLRIRGEQPSNPVGLDDLAAFGITPLPEQVAALMSRAGLEVTPEQLNELKAAHAANAELRASAAAARNRSLNPQDPPPDEGGD